MWKFLFNRKQVVQQIISAAVILLIVLVVDFVISGVIFGARVELDWAPACVAGIIYGIASIGPIYARAYQLQWRFSLDLLCALAALFGFGMFLVALSREASAQDRAVIVSVHMWTTGVVQVLLMTPFHIIRSVSCFRAWMAARTLRSARKISRRSRSTTVEYGCE